MRLRSDRARARRRWCVGYHAAHPRDTERRILAQVVELEQNLRDLQVADGRETLSLSKVLSFADAEMASRQGPLLVALLLSARLQGMRAAMPDFSRILLTETPDYQGKHWLAIHAAEP